MKTLIRVLMLGEHWDRLDQTFASLSNRGVVEFVGPVHRELQEAVLLTSPSAIMISPGSEKVGRGLLNAPASERSILPPILLCVDHESLESEELYEYADDFLLLACSAAEMEKRLNRLVWGNQTESPSHLLRLGEITLDTHIYEVRIEGKRVELA